MWQVSPQARRAGVKAGLTVSQAIGLCPTLRLCEADPVHYDDQFTRLLAALRDVSPVIEAPELGRAFVGTDGLERLYGEPGKIVEKIECVVRSAWLPTVPTEDSASTVEYHAPRTTHLFSVLLGFGTGKFVSWVAATHAKPGSAVIVPVGEEARFLAAQPLGVLPLDSDTHRRLRQLGLCTLGALVAIPEQAIVSQLGGAGARLWRLAAGKLVEPVVGREAPEPIVASMTFFSPVTDREMLRQAVAQLLDRALKHPRRTGWRVQEVRVRAELEYSASWMHAAVLKEPTADRDRVAAPLNTRLEQSPPVKAVERLTVEFTAFAPGTIEQQLFARDANAAARAGRRRALRAAAQEIALRLERPMLQHVIELQPSSRIPERRYALIDYEP